MARLVGKVINRWERCPKCGEKINNRKVRHFHNRAFYKKEWRINPDLTGVKPIEVLSGFGPNKTYFLWAECEIKKSCPALIGPKKKVVKKKPKPRKNYRRIIL